MMAHSGNPKQLRRQGSGGSVWGGILDKKLMSPISIDKLGMVVFTCDPSYA
jgi:hypothetical protein